jgi:predicted Ser/Thr protein kinase
MSAVPRPHAATQPNETVSASTPMSQVPQALPSGTVLQGRYSIEGVLGSGGMSVVYRGRDTRFTQVARYCAIKEMFQTAPDSATRMLRLHHFEREAGLLATINHPAVPKVYDFFEEHGRVYAIMELVPGTDLEALLHQHGKPFAQARVANWALQLCDVLHHLHTAGSEPIIFRDLKPSNIMVTPDERIVVIDFGIARVFADKQQGKGTLIGTEGYAPPEQYRGVVDVRGDVYALGATLHHLLTNVDPRTEVPFTFHERSVRLFNPSVSAVFEDVLNNTLQYDMDSRPQSIAEVKALLLSVPTIGTTGGSHAATLVPAATAHAQGRGVCGQLRQACVRAGCACRHAALAARDVGRCVVIAYGCQRPGDRWIGRRQRVCARSAYRGATLEHAHRAGRALVAAHAGSRGVCWLG